MFYVDVAKVDRDVVYVAMAKHVCLQVCFLNVSTDSSRCCMFSSGCCICCSGYTRMLQMYVPNVLPVSDVCCK